MNWRRERHLRRDREPDGMVYISALVSNWPCGAILGDCENSKTTLKCELSFPG